jgi:energy-coupling factor transport system permease protein
MSLDPRAQLLVLLLLVFLATLGGWVGTASVALAALAVLLARGAMGRLRVTALALVPFVVLIVLFDWLAGGAIGPLIAGRLVALGLLGAAVSEVASGDRLAAGLSALRMPYALTFVLVAGARFIPRAFEDLGRLRDSARLRGLPLEGPIWQQLPGWRKLLVPLLVITIRRGLQLGEAMEARAFGASRRRSSRVVLRWTGGDSLAVLAALLAFVALFALEVLRLLAN